MFCFAGKAGISWVPRDARGTCKYRFELILNSYDNTQIFQTLNARFTCKFIGVFSSFLG